MARYQRSYFGERRTVKRTTKLTPSEAAELDVAAAIQGASWSDYSRELMLRRSAAVVAATRRNPEAAAIIQALDAAGHEQQRIGNNLNQLARVANTTGELRRLDELRYALALYQQVTERHIAALERVLAL